MTTDANNNNTTSSPAISRYQRVKQILDAAYTSQALPSYQGLGDFWNTLSYTDFMQFKLYGEKLIADKPQKSCCGKEPTYTRAQASGLIKGLRGAFPYNGEQFPALPWAAELLTEQDIGFIESWINDDCPETDGEPVVALAHSRKTTMVDPLNLSPSLSSSSNINAFKRINNEPKQRKNVDNLTEEELCKLREAFRWARSLNAWPRDRRSLNSWGKLHGDVCAHGFEQFLTWHRMFLYDFEKNLQDFDPDVTLPFWDWTSSKYDANRDTNKPSDGGVIPKAFCCFITEEAIKQLETEYYLPANVAAKLRSVVGQHFSSGVQLFDAAKIEGEEYKNNAAVIVKKLEDINPLWYNARYPNMFYETEKGNPNVYVRDKETNKPIPINNGLLGFNHHFPGKQDVDNLLALEYWRDFAGGPTYNQAFGLVDMEPHNTIHIWVGGFNPNYDAEKAQNDNAKDLLDTNRPGDMLDNLTAGFDPIFWPHHVNIDRIFTMWQQRHPSQVPYGMDIALVGLGYNTRDALNAEALGYEYVDAAAYYVVDKNQPAGTVTLGAETINHAALSTCRRVELRLHQVKQPTESMYVHAFINQPNLDLNTQVKGNDKYAGYVSLWGHGSCVGGPGHCAVPSESADPYDLRGPNHNAKRNLTLDITQALRAAVARGEVTAQVSLYALDASLTHVAEELDVEAVSINYVN